MSTLATSFVAIVAFLNGIILLGSISPVSAYRSFSFERELGKYFLTISPSAVENSTVYYAACADGGGEPRLDCVLYRVKGDFSGGSPKEDKCNITMQSEFGGVIVLGFTRIDPLGRDRAIVRWAEQGGDTGWDNYSFRLSIVDFSNCKVTTTKSSRDLDHFLNGGYLIGSRDVDGFYTMHYQGFYPSRTDFNWPMYQKGEDDFEIVSIVYGEKSFSNTSMREYVEVLTASIDADGVIAKISTLIPPTLTGFTPTRVLIYPLWKDQGYLYMTSEIPAYLYNRACCGTMTVALIQPNGQRRNLTHLQDVYTVATATVSLAHGMIGICARQNLTTMQCTQFRLDDREIRWFPVSLYMEDRRNDLEIRRAIYNLPRGEGFLTQIVRNRERKVYEKITDKYLLKIGPDGKVKQFLDPDMFCRGRQVIAGMNQIFEDDRGNYCVSTMCVRFIHKNFFGREPHFVKLQSKCFEPEEFKNVSKYEVIAEYENGYPRKDDLNDGLINYDLLIE